MMNGKPFDGAFLNQHTVHTGAAGSSPTSGQRQGNFFAFHGWLAPGVRLFRHIGFPAKALWLAGSFLIPIVLMLTQIWMGSMQDIKATQAERSGVQFAGPVLELIRLAQESRLQSATGQPHTSATREALQNAFADVERWNRSLGADFQVGSTFKPLSVLHAALMGSPATSTAGGAFELHSQYIDAALDLVREIVDGSSLRLDPERDTYHMMNMSMLSGPLQYENTARLRDMGTLMLQSGAIESIQRESMLEWSAVQKYLDKDVENSYQEGVERFPDVAAVFDMKGTDAASEAFTKAIAVQVLGKVPAKDATEYLKLGNLAVNGQILLAKKGLERLDFRLAERVDRLKRALLLQTGLSLFFVLFAAYLLLSFYRVMLGGLKAVTNHLQAITSGNLTLAPEPWGRDETAELMITMGEMQASLRRIVSVVLRGSAEVQGGSGDIASASRNLSKQTAVAAASLEHAGQTMGLINSQVEQTTQTVLGAMAIVRENADVAMRGGKVVNDVVITMDEISRSSHRIGEIISVIDGIAFQTNLLALNAAVEAARAGEQGRGFAVVATEVRALAGRSAMAAKEIKELVSQSIAKVQSGNEVVAQAGRTIGEIVTNADRISAMMEQISHATREQSEGMQKIETTVHDLDQATQRNASQAERTTASAMVLAEQALSLVEEVSFFRIEQ